MCASYEIFLPCNRIPRVRRAHAIKSNRATHTIARFESSKPFKSRYSFDDVRAGVSTRAHVLKIRSSKDESIHRELALLWRRATFQCDPMGPLRTFLLLVPSIDSVSLFVSSIKFLFLFRLRFPTSFPFSLPDKRVHAQHSIENCLSALSNVQLT